MQFAPGKWQGCPIRQGSVERGIHRKWHLGAQRGKSISLASLGSSGPQTQARGSGKEPRAELQAGDRSRGQGGVGDTMGQPLGHRQLWAVGGGCCSLKTVHPRAASAYHVPSAELPARPGAGLKALGFSGAKS